MKLNYNILQKTFPTKAIFTSTHFSNSSYNFFSVIYPGIYEIYCKVNNKRYIGEAANVLDRLGKHSRALLVRKSECTELQKDWNTYTYGPAEFEAHILYSGEEWKDKEKRCSLRPSERWKKILFVVTNLKKFTMNILIFHFKEKKIFVIFVKCQSFDSVYEASRKLGEKESSISNKLKNGVEGYVLIAKVRHGYEPIIADGFVYDSIAAAVNDKTEELLIDFKPTNF